MLRQRLLTAAVLIPLFIWCIMWLATAQLAFLLAVVVGLGAWEWSGLFAPRKLVIRGIYVIAVLISQWLVWLRLLADPDAVYWLVPIVFGWFGVAAMLLYQSRPSIGPASSKLDAVDAAGPAAVSGPVLAVLGFLTLVPAWSALMILHGRDNGPQEVLFLLVLVWVADSGAYFAGRRWGKKKLAPLISPGKTIEGVAGALVLTLLVAVPGGIILHIYGFNLLYFSILCLVTVVLSITGDLAESWIKRQARVKDSGHILPGHGGVLDRIDSLTAAAPVFAVGLFTLRAML